MRYSSKAFIACSQNSPISGFSLIDVTIALAIVAILSSIALPAMSSWVDSARSKSTERSLYSMAYEARSLALSQSQTITICKLIDNDCSSDFGLPLSVFSDGNRNANLDLDEEVMREIHIGLPDGVDLRWNRARYMRFWPSGATGALNGSLSYCDSRNSSNDFRLVISRTGRVRIDSEDSRCG